MKNIESTLPVFKGFYGSIFEYDNEIEDIDHAISEGEAPEGAEFNDFTFDYKDYNNRLALSMVDTIEGELPFDVKFTFDSISSPRYYNFTNDQIIVKYELTDKVFNEILDYLKEYTDEFSQYVKDRFTSYDGFSSFYSNDINVWFNEYVNDADKMETLFGSMLDFICINEEIDTEMLYEGISDDNWINYTYKLPVSK